jgi:3-methyladenine DNA glycosylase AlkD
VLNQIKREIKSLSDPKRARLLAGYFKTGPGQYGEGDIFLGLTASQIKKIARQFSDLSLARIQKLLSSRFHEHRSVALAILVRQYQKAKDEKTKKVLVDFYLKNTKWVNNWDLVDGSAPKILGDYLLDKDKSILYRLAKSENLWERRIAVLASFAFIRENRFEVALKLSQLLLRDQHDLIHKAVGWALREVGKKDQKTEEKFLQKNLSQMPRTMLRYAIEKFSPTKRQEYLKK